MKIKTTKKMRLDELIQYIFDNGIEDEGFIPSNQSTPHDEVRVSGSGNIKTIGYINKNTTFTVEVEEELTEETVIRGLADVFFDPLVGGPNVEFHIDCIKNIKQDAMETYSLAIFYKDTLVWSRESGIPESGVLEVEADVQ